jgi:hypothetical protein
MGELIRSIMLGFAAFGLARGVDIPAWIDWPTHEVPADATDIGFLVAVASYRRTQPKAPTHDS